jgi:hypothetical protein
MLLYKPIDLVEVVAWPCPHIPFDQRELRVANTEVVRDYRVFGVAHIDRLARFAEID